jgi:hypothetical protein
VKEYDNLDFLSLPFPGFQFAGHGHLQKFNMTDAGYGVMVSKNHVEAGISIVAAFVVLFSAMINPLVSAGIAFAFLFILGLYLALFRR